MTDDALDALREALKLSPDNIPLRQHLAETLMGVGRYDEAEKEYRAALARDAGNVKLKLGLANAFYQQEKNSAALVIVEELIKTPAAPARAYILYAKLLVRAGERRRACVLGEVAAQRHVQLGCVNFRSRGRAQRSDHVDVVAFGVVVGRQLQESTPLDFLEEFTCLIVMLRHGRVSLVWARGRGPRGCELTTAAGKLRNGEAR